ncbi:hypothetical protein WMF20_41830 [Sorangium sp. So ce834]|uniref:hypothetical protein n=1 Tax=Sorangium sp. So ce834 TaxID=3133321 RepID=UPI003F610602
MNSLVLSYRWMASCALLIAALCLGACGSESDPVDGAGSGDAETGGTTGSAGPTTGGSTSGGTGGGASAAGTTVGTTGTGGDGTGGAGAGGSASGSTASTGGAGGTAGTGGGDDGLPPTGDNSVAYTGCSMANNIGTGYKRVGGRIMWNSDDYQTGAMVVQNWTNPNSSSWQLFDRKMASIGGKDVVKAIMVQICILSQRATDQELRDMVNAARQHVDPGTHIYIVGQPVYNEGHDCFIAGAGGADWTNMKAQELANDPTINENMSYLGKFILNNDAGEVSDGCHASSPKGENVLGEQAKAFFGG